MLLGELQGVDHAQHLVDVAAQGQVVDHLVAHVAGLIDEEGAAEGDLGFRVLHVVGLADAVVDVGQKRSFKNTGILTLYNTLSHRNIRTVLCLLLRQHIAIKVPCNHKYP